MVASLTQQWRSIGGPSINPMEYIKLLKRRAEAHRMLANTDLNVGECRHTLRCK